MVLLSEETAEWVFWSPPPRQMCGVAVLVFGVYMLVNFRMAALTPTLASFNSANMLLISGIIITCVSFLGFLGALKENRCLLLTVRHTRRPFAPQLYKRCLLHTVPCVVGFFFISKCWLYVLQIIRSNWDTVSENSWIFVMFFFNAVTPQIPLVSASGDRYLNYTLYNYTYLKAEYKNSEKCKVDVCNEPFG